MTAKSNLRLYVEELARCVDFLESDCASRGVSIPDIDDAVVVHPNNDNDFERSNKKVADAVNSIITTGMLLVQSVRTPTQSVRIVAASHIASASLRCVTELHIADRLRIAGPDGIHVDELAATCNVEAGHLSQMLRVISSQGIFKEAAPDVFANNRLSIVLDKGLTQNELDGNPTSHDILYKNPQSATCALFCHLMDESSKATSYLFEALSESRTPGAPTAFQRAFDTKKSLFEFFEQPSQGNRLRRFGLAMEGAARTEPKDAIINGFDWESVKTGHVVDVGGGVGAVSMRLTSAYPEMNIVVQDRQPVVEDGLKRCTTINPTAIQSGKVKFQGHDFFTEQPIKAPDVFFIKFIVHDWPDDANLKILTRLREAAGPKTRLFSMDKIIPYTCETNESETEGITFAGPAAGEVKNGLGNILSYLPSVLMIAVLNGQERSLKHTVSLYRKAGWEVYKVYQSESQGQFASQIEARPVDIP